MSSTSRHMAPLPYPVLLIWPPRCFNSKTSVGWQIPPDPVGQGIGAVASSEACKNQVELIDRRIETEGKWRTLEDRGSGWVTK